MWQPAESPLLFIQIVQSFIPLASVSVPGIQRHQDRPRIGGPLGEHLSSKYLVCVCVSFVCWICLSPHDTQPLITQITRTLYVSLSYFKSLKGLMFHSALHRISANILSRMFTGSWQLLESRCCYPSHQSSWMTGEC